MTATYPWNMKAAAHRHLLAAEALDPGPRRDVAGYLYGWAAECAIKALMLDLGMQPLPPEDRREDPFYAHFTDLKRRLRDSNQGRKHVDLRKFSDNSRFMEHWDTSMRYSDGKSIKPRWIDRWHEDAKAVLAEI